MKTSVEWLVQEINKLTGLNVAIDEPIIEQAMEMEKKQIENAWLSAWKNSMLNPLEDKYYQPEAEQYYNETFNK